MIYDDICIYIYLQRDNIFGGEFQAKGPARARVEIYTKSQISWFSQKFLFRQLSNEKLGYMGHYTTQLYRGYNKPI